MEGWHQFTMLMRTSLNQRKHCELGIQVLVGIHDVLDLLIRSSQSHFRVLASTACAYICACGRKERLHARAAAQLRKEVFLYTFNFVRAQSVSSS